MKKLTVFAVAGLLAFSAQAAEIGGKFAFGFEQGVALNDGTSDNLGRGCSFKLCLSNNIAIKGAVGLNYSAKINPVVSETNPLDTLYQEDKAKIDWTAAAYGILVFRRFEKVHLNGMAGLVVSATDNHFKKETLDETAGKNDFIESEESPRKLDVHLRVLMAPEIFIFPNFSLEYKYGFDVAIKKNTKVYSNGPISVQDEQSRLNVDIIGDLNLLSSASVHFYF
ncbi:MAG: hypothetical protein JNL74_21505 [Fibrobacteres bacterium]|nr:hypothetical protein [Fibrobacterota bacterium]